MFRKKAYSVKMKRNSMVCSSSLYSLRTTDRDKPACGFLNRKSVLETSGKKSKDRTWVTFWCQVKDGKMEFYKVNGFTLKPHGEPPPKDIYPPPNRHKQSTGVVFLENCLVEIDYTSQEEKDLDKRRRFLFRLILSNKIEYLFQGPSENIMLQWVTHIKRATFSTDPELNGPSELLSGDARIKASRCSINKKSKYNTNSVRVKATVDGDEDIDCSLASLIKLDPRLVHLRKRLQNKRELMRQLQKMLTSFSGDTECLYKESETTFLRLSNPPDSDSERPVPRYSASSNGSSEGFTKTTTTLLEDYYMLPGVEWSLVKKGETVEVLGKLSNGWYRCRTNKDTAYELEDFPSNEAIDDSSEVGSADTTSTRDELTATPVLLKEAEGDSSLLQEISTSLGEEYIPKDIFDQEEEEDHEVEKDRLYRTKSISMAFANPIISYNTEEEHQRDRTESYLIATMSEPIGTFKRQNLFRKDSYNTATSPGSLIDSIEVGNNRTRHLSMLEPILSPSISEAPSSPNFSQEYELKKLRINNILDHEKANNRYIFPLIGLIPSSVLRNFIGHPTLVVGMRPSSSTSDYGSSSGPVTESTTLNGHIKSSSFDAAELLSHGIDIPRNSERDSSEIFSGSFELESLSYASTPIKQLNQPLGRKHSDRSLSLPTNSLIPLGYERESLSEAPSPEPILDYLENDVIEDDEEREDEEEEGENDSISKLRTPRRRMSSKTLKVIPSPTSTLERELTSSTKRELAKELRKEGKKGRGHSDDTIGKHSHKGLLSRIRSNLSGLKKSSGIDSPKHHRSAMTSDAEMRTRVTSISGKAMISKGMGITFGDSSSESESEDTAEDKQNKVRESKSNDSSPLLGDRKQLSLDSDSHHSNSSRSSTPESPIHESVFKTHSTPVEILKQKAKARMQSDSTQENLRKRVESASSSLKNRRNSFLQEGTSVSGFIQAPPRGVKRCIYLDPAMKKFGFHLEKYELLNDGQITSQTIVQHVVPGSSAFVAGFFPGDHIVSVNGKDVRNATVQEVASAIQQADPNRRIEVMVAFIEGAIRIKKKQEREDLQIQLVEKQKNLNTLITTEQKLPIKPSSSSLQPSSPVSPVTMFANDLQSWREDTPPEENSLHVFNYNREINSILSLHHGDITQLSCDLLVVPLQRMKTYSVEDNIRDVLKVGGAGLMDELSLAKQCELGNNIYTEGHGLPAQAVCHCVYSSNDDDIFKCCRQSLKVARQKKYQNIVFWVSGFISSTYVSPHHMICAIRGWLEEGGNCCGNLKVVLSVPSTPAMISLIERYFPLEDYQLYDFLQGLNYFTSDDEDDHKMDDDSSRDTVAPKIPPRLSRHAIPTPIATSPLSNGNGNTIDRTKYVKNRFTEIDDILNNIHDEVSAMK